MAQQEIRDVVFNVQVRAEDGKVKIEGLTKTFVKSETAFKKMRQAIDSTNDALNKTGANAGLANTAVLEFGRTVSDAPYGIQGMGNNITQLVTIFGQLSQKAKETGETVGSSLKTALKGPLGIVIFVQIAVAALEIFRKKLSETTDTLTKLDVAVGKSAVNLKLAKTALDNESTSLKEKQEIVDALNEQYPEWNLQLSKSGDLSADNVAKIDAEIQALGRLAKAKAYQSLLEEAYAKRVEMSASFAREQGTTLARVKNVMAGMGSETAGMTMRFKAFQAGMKDINEEIAFLEKGVQSEGLVDLLLGTSKKKKDAKPERRKKIKELTTETYDIAIIEAEKERKRIEKAFKAMGLDYPSLILGGEEGKAALGEGILSLADGLQETGYSDRTKETMRKAVFPEDILDGLDSILDSASGLLEAQAQKDLAIEQNKTNALNDQLKARLANEQLSAEERDKINQEISRNEALLVERENKINEKRFKQQKALQIATATAELYRTAFLAYGSQLVIGDPSSPIRAQIAQGIALATGLANIAMIAKQQFVGKAMPSPTLVAQGVGANAQQQAPSFNVVGAAGQNQLAAAIAGQMQQPVKAYVVSSDVTTAQELDRRIVQGASI